MADNDRNRVFHYAVLASLALHALLVFGFPDFIDSARRAVSLPPALIARLMEPEPAPAPAPAEAPPANKAEVAKPVPRITEPAPQLAAPPAPDTRADQSAPPTEVQAPPAPVPAPPPVAAAGPQQASAVQQAAPAPESLSRDQYRVQLIDEARRHKRYPPLARENNWQGDVRVGVAIAANGRPTVTLKGSSGYEVLDRQALEMFRQAARAVPVPPALRGKEFALEVRAVYGLEE
ncbi:MAG: energy transducer TonB [Panacagrimonas sp.]